MAVIKSVPKIGKGRPISKRSKIHIFRAEDIETFPPVAADGVSSSGNLTLKTGKKGWTVYVTSQSLSRSDKTEGDYPSTAFLSTVTGVYPGNNRYIDSLINELAGDDLILITGECEEEMKNKLHGAICAPMALTSENADDNETNTRTLTFTQTNRYHRMSMYYDGEIPTAIEEEATEDGSSALGGA